MPITPVSRDPVRRLRPPIHREDKQHMNVWNSSTTAPNAAPMCHACSARACGSCAEGDCACFSVFGAWRAYHAVTIRPARGRDEWRPETAQPPPHHAYTGRHERNLDFRLDRVGRRERTPRLEAV